MMRMNEVRMSDAEVRQEVLREMRWDSRLKGARVDAAVRDATVTLTGTVADSSELLAAVESAGRAEGIFEVRSELRVDPYGGRPPTDANILEAVRRALEREAPHAQITAAVSNGWVALHGAVGRRREREQAERLARRLEGVRGVYNLVEVSASEGHAAGVRERIEEALRRRAQREAESIEVTFSGGTVSLAGHLRTWDEKEAVLWALTQAPGIERVEDRLSVDVCFYDGG